MALTIGTRLGVYEVTAQIGEGGMGQVYRARDTKLNRDVALKVLPDSFANDPDRLARFTREAQTLASLNHPHIAQIYGLQEGQAGRAGLAGQEGTTPAFLIMELVEGENLAQRITRGAIPLDEALPIARQIAEALEAAHEQGIIHRDLKPANIKVRPDGTVKVLDFGLAKAIEVAGTVGEAGRAGLTQSPTITSPAMTQAGMILGTAAYMSPEQARGKAVDKRADIWAFGCVLYEMLVGRRAFEGEDISDTLANVLKTEPDWAALPLDTPPHVRALVERCVNKDPRARVADMSVVRYVLDQRLDYTAAPHATAAVPAASGRILGLLTTLAMGAAIAAGLTWFIVTSRVPTAPGQPVRRFAITFASDTLFQGIGRHILALSPDGSRLVYAANGRLFMRVLDQLDATPLPGTDPGATEPVFSPDGRWLGFWQGGQIKKVGVTGGGTPVVIAPASNLYGLSWSGDDTLLFGQASAIYRVPASGGTPEVLLKFKDDQSVHGPQLLPGGRAVLYTLRTGVVQGGSWERAQIVVRSLESSTERVLIPEGTDGRYVSTGHVVFGRGGTIFAVPFDLASLSIRGSAVSLVDGLSPTGGGNSGAMQFAAAQDGTLVYRPQQVQQRTTVWVDRSGAEEPTGVEPHEYYAPRISPEGTRVVVDDRVVSKAELWVFELGRKTRTRLTFEPGIDAAPQWTPDGQYVVYGNDGEGSLNLFRRRADGTGNAERLTKNPTTQAPLAVTPDGAFLLFRQQDIQTRSDLYLLGLGSSREPRLLLRTPADEQDAAISPDSKWMAYRSDESGRMEVYVRPFPNVDAGRWQVSVGGGLHPVWARNGRELFFRSLDGSMMVTEVSGSSTFTSGTPRKLFGGSYFSANNARNYDVSPDGKRFLMIKAVAAQDPSQIVVVEHWFEELKARVPIGK